jgi:hypothetical protein
MKINCKPRSNRKAPFIATLALASAFAAGNAGAGIPVTDLGNMPNHIITQINSLLNQINTYTQKFQDYAQYAAEIKHMTQQLTQLGQLFNTLGLNMTSINEKTAQDLSDTVKDRCSGNTSILSDVFSSIGLDMNGDIAAQQKVKCIQIVNLQFDQFNEQVRLLKKLKETQAQIKKIEGQMAVSKENGAMDTNVAQTAKLTAQLLADTQYTETVIRTYEGMIKMVEEDQRQLAKRAMKGENTLIGEILSTTALATALKVND